MENTISVQENSKPLSSVLIIVILIAFVLLLIICLTANSDDKKRIKLENLRKAFAGLFPEEI